MEFDIDEDKKRLRIKMKSKYYIVKRGYDWRMSSCCFSSELKPNEEEFTQKFQIATLDSSGMFIKIEEYYIKYNLKKEEVEVSLIAAKILGLRNKF